MLFTSLVAYCPEQAGNGKSRQRNNRKDCDPHRPSPVKEPVEIICVGPRTAYAVYQDIKKISCSVNERRYGRKNSKLKWYLFPSYKYEFDHGSYGQEQMEEQIAPLIELQKSVKRSEHECNDSEGYRYAADGRKLKCRHLPYVLFREKADKKNERNYSAEDIRQYSIEFEILQS